jgi:hypothetical protein
LKVYVWSNYGSSQKFTKNYSDWKRLLKDFELRINLNKIYLLIKYILLYYI